MLSVSHVAMIFCSFKHSVLWYSVLSSTQYYHSCQLLKTHFRDRKPHPYATPHNWKPHPRHTHIINVDSVQVGTSRSSKAHPPTLLHGNSHHAGAASTPKQVTTSACGAGMVTSLMTKEYVFYYNYVTRFLALFHVFICGLALQISG